MEFLSALARWLFVETIYGSGAVAFGLGYIASRIFVRHKEVAAGLAGLTGLLGTMATGFYLGLQDKYEFSDKAYALLDQTPWVKVVSTSTSIELYELPFISSNRQLTTHFHTIMPAPDGGFYDSVIKYGKDEVLRIADPDCKDLDKTIRYSYRMKDGTFRYTDEYPYRMTDQEYETFCEYDWTPNINAYIDASVALEDNDADKAELRKYLEGRMLLPYKQIKQKE
jgi:hypothetical protein